MGGFGGMRVVYIYIFYFLCIMMFDIFTKKKKKTFLLQRDCSVLS